ncbi:molybdate ABC transporter substrate-binding protein [Parvibaculaceae bacterium PLY_AMNH_Bact1]|nr:molybdate ABC transporter substrate-binding protein [Parvibaculaceae bacterium PLY_AMNH_Bact1]
MRATLFVACVSLVYFSLPAYGDGAACEPITIFAAASTTDVLEEIASEYEKETACSVSTVFAGSGTLARQIEAGAPADLFLSANADWAKWIANAGLIRPENKVDLLTNQLVFIVSARDPDARLNIQQAERLRNYLSNGKLAIGDPNTVPAGRYAQAVLRHFGLGGLGDGQVVRASSVRSAVTWVARGEARAGIVYRTDAAIEGEVRIAGSIPSVDGIDITYPLALVGRTPNNAAVGFFRYLQSYDAAAVFADHGFSRISAR